MFFFSVNDVVPIGAVIATIRTEKTEEIKSDDDTRPALPSRKFPAHTDDNNHEEPARNFSRFEAHPRQNNAVNRFYSPLVMNIASSEGVSLKELEQIPGTGNEGRVTKKDILQFIEHRKKTSTNNSEVAIRTNSDVPVNEERAENQAPARYNGQVEIIEMDRMRRLIADHMVRSVHTSPHVTSFSEADVTNMVLWRESVKKEFEKREGTKITFTPLFIEALVRCIKKFPLINSSLDGNNIIIKKDISNAIGVQPEIYATADDDFIKRLKKLRRNVLVVAHSNTIDEIVNGLSGGVKLTADLPDSEYDNLFVVAYKKKKVLFAAKKYGKLVK